MSVWQAAWDGTGADLQTLEYKRTICLVSGVGEHRDQVGIWRKED